MLFSDVRILGIDITVSQRSPFIFQYVPHSLKSFQLICELAIKPCISDMELSSQLASAVLGSSI
jgi:hypothetical protein